MGGLSATELSSQAQFEPTSKLLYRPNTQSLNRQKAATCSRSEPASPCSLTMNGMSLLFPAIDFIKRALRCWAAGPLRAGALGSSCGALKTDEYLWCACPSAPQAFLG